MGQESCKNTTKIHAKTLQVFFCKIIKDSCQNLTKSDKIHARILQDLTRLVQEPYKI